MSSDVLITGRHHGYYRHVLGEEGGKERHLFELKPLDHYY